MTCQWGRPLLAGVRAWNRHRRSALPPIRSQDVAVIPALIK